MSSKPSFEIVKLRDRLSDLPTVARWVVEQWGDHAFEETAVQLADPPGCPASLLAVAEGRPVGVVGYRRFQREGEHTASLWINVLYVIQSCRGEGIGSDLLTQATLQAREYEEVLFVYTEVASFYASRGWSLIDHDPMTKVTVLRRST